MHLMLEIVLLLNLLNYYLNYLASNIKLNMPEKEEQWIADTLTHTLGGRACSKLWWLWEW
jgi:hypothetical protein